MNPHPPFLQYNNNEIPVEDEYFHFFVAGRNDETREENKSRDVGTATTFSLVKNVAIRSIQCCGLRFGNSLLVQNNEGIVKPAGLVVSASPPPPKARVAPSMSEAIASRYIA